MAHIREQIANIENGMVSLKLGTTSYTRQRKLSSDQVWEHFENHIREDGTERAICKYCMKNLVGSINNRIEHLEKHLERCIGKHWLIGIEVGRFVNDQRLNKARMIFKHSDRSSLDSSEAEMIQVYKEEKERFCKYLENLSCRFCLRIHEYLTYFWFSVHFIDDDWKLKEKIISFKNIKENSNILKCLTDVLLEWGIDKNISSLSKVREVENDAADYVMSFNEMKSWFTDRGSLPFAGEFLYIDSLDDMTSDYWHLCSNLDDSVFNKMSKIFNFVQKTSSDEQNFVIAIEKAKSLGKQVTSEVNIPKKEEYWELRRNLEVAIGFKDAFCELENIDTEFKLINLKTEEWDQIMALNECYKELKDDFINSRKRCCTANVGFVFLCELYTRSLLLKKIHLLFDDEEELNWFKNLLDEYWCKTNMVLAAAAVLDPRFKLDVVEHWYKKIYGSDQYETQLTLFKDYFTSVYDEYSKSFGYCGDGVLWQKEAELDRYLKDDEFVSIKEFDILNWWYFNSRYFPTLAKMARDFLSISVSSHISDEYFVLPYISYICDIEDRKCLDSHTVNEVFICTKSWLETP